MFPSKNTSPILLTGEGPGIAAPKAMEWGTEMIGIHRQYQSWGYLDPFPVLLEGARRCVCRSGGGRGGSCRQAVTMHRART